MARKRILKDGLLCTLVFFASAITSAALNIGTRTNEPYTMVERSDFSRYDNGKYIGHVYREVRAAINPSGTDSDGSTRYKGNFIVMEETLRDMRQNARPVNAVVPVNFALNAQGGMRIEDDKGFPALRNFPYYTQPSITKGFTWKASGQRAVDPLNEGKTLIVPFTAVYEYKGIEDYKGIPVHRIEASYKSDTDFTGAEYTADSTDSSGNGRLSKLTGKHDVTILIAVENGIMLLSRDNLDETFSWNDGKTVRFRGFTLCFAQSITPIDSNKIKKEMETANGVEFEPVDTGLRLSIRDIQFVSDSSELLPNEAARLDRIAASLAGIEGRTFLVEGHTAATGRPESEKRLSVERAKRIVDELSSRGIPAGRFIYKGWGGEKPVGDNSTDAGRRLNRRVEITILD
ncbi:MAG: OmpA family protein [Spirochaetaceae bacterium]|jgi:outer membrane protein OmpA-like peptidoglycan-associated protein|nr:OmpA family protein [Spirochaetaceae bacterium]